MMPKKSEAQKRKPTGVSLPGELLRAAQEHVVKHEYDSLSALIVKLLRDEIKKTGDRIDGAGRKNLQGAKAKLRRR